jgi:sentrin-specific protease 8
MDNEMYLSHNNILLRRSDFDCFRDYCQINDMCISFYYDYLNKSNNVLLLDPVAVSTIIFFEDSIEELKEYFPLNMENKEYIFLPVNDNTNKFNYGGGSHWALIVYQKSDNCFYYIDSMLSYINNTNILCDKISKIMDRVEGEIVKADIIKYQENTYDCGMFVLAFTQFLLNYINNLAINKNCFKDAFDGLNQSFVKKMRKDIIKLINSLKKK